MPKLGPPLRGPPVVVVQNTTKSLSAVNRAVHIGPVDQLLDQFVVESLVVTLLMVVLRVVCQKSAELTSQRLQLLRAAWDERPQLK